MLAVLFLVAASVLLAVILIRDRDAVDAGGTEARQAQDLHHNLGDAGEAEFVSIFVYQQGGDMTSYMVSDSTDNFGGLAAAVTGAKPVAGERDESFTDLLVFSFKDRSTMELSYSSARNLLSYEDALYMPAADLAPMIGEVEARFDQS